MRQRLWIVAAAIVGALWPAESVHPESPLELVERQPVIVLEWEWMR
jgi:hypothetical protein